jgi:hypothetical protein
VAPLKGVIEYKLLLPEQIIVDPDMVPGVAGTLFTVIPSVCTELAPQVLFAVTVTDPLFAPAVVVMLYVVLVPDQPPGRVHV